MGFNEANIGGIKMKLLRDKVKRDTYMASKVCGMISRGDLRNDHPQQRKSGQWENEVRDNFIVTVIQNEDFDPIKICEQLTENGIILWLIDGLQRCTTIEKYKAGEFALGKNIDPSVIEYQEVKRDEKGKIVKDENGCTMYEIVSCDLRGKSYAQLPERLKEDFDNCPVEVVKHLDCSDKEVGRHIVRYNSGAKMNVAQKTITYMYNVAEDVKKLSGHAFFSDCVNFSDIKDKNGTIDKIVNETIMGLNFFDRWQRDAKKLGKFLNENAKKYMFENFRSELDRLYNITTPTTGKMFNEKNGVIWFMLFDKFSKTGLSDEIFGNFLNHFEELKDIKVTVEHVRKPKGSEETNHLSFVEIDTCNSTKDKGIIEDKLHILETLMNEYLHIEDSENVDNTIESTTENISEDLQPVIESIENNINIEETPLNFIRENVKSDADEEDIKDYDEYLDNIVRVSSPIYQKCKIALLALTAYVYTHEQDEEFAEWLEKYQNEKTDFSDNQTENYIYILDDFENYMRVHKEGQTNG